jgi:DNA-binding NtrC family response regulator
MEDINNSTRILIVDDDLNFRSAQKRTLRRMKIRPSSKIEVIEASSGTEAMELLRVVDIDCMLLDYNMPGGSGLDWLTKFLERNKYLAVIMLTGQGSEQLAVNAMKNGAMDYLVKGSLTPEDLERTILNAVEKVELRRTITEQKNRLIDAERQRVMIESLGAACHHIGQPATVISSYLQLMQDQEKDEKIQQMITACMEASDSMANILQQLMQVSQYRTSPYLPGEENQSSDNDRDSIIAIN